MLNTTKERTDYVPFQEILNFKIAESMTDKLDAIAESLGDEVLWKNGDLQYSQATVKVMCLWLDGDIELTYKEAKK